MYHIITAPKCSYCDKAKGLLTSEDHEFTTYDLSDSNFLLTLFKEAGYKTVPQIWYEGTYIGGYTELYEYLWSET